ncbi:DUF2523 family protein [Thalassotalea sp. ND16A]|uniref:DUF2523 family protein n=1 Tax=Thalassotalea sp. ND16A TaxID=1535422 RepID=UPI000519FCC5|nr:DUF2523 family protein [Thalassotalea sp. ND16A]KGK00286.1 hypothetical protein ND16A_3622 [Thalassotalea sp. ND16A]
MILKENFWYRFRFQAKLPGEDFGTKIIAGEYYLGKLLVLFLIVSLIFPNVVFAAADPQTGITGGLQAINNRIEDLWSFMNTDVPGIFQEMYVYLVTWWVKVKITWWFESVKFFWGVAKILIQDLTLGSQIAAAMTALPQDVKQAGIDSGIFDGLNIILQAYVTRFAMRVF